MQTWPGSAPDTRKNTTGPGASSFKYDVLTALLVTAARGNAEVARLALRLSLVITARYNWRQESFAVGQREMARMWGVTERTAKREMAAMRARGWLKVAVPAARGRVAQHRIVFDAVLRETVAHWDAVGPDFAARMSAAPEPETAAAANVVPFQPRHEPHGHDSAAWRGAADRLAAQDAALFNAWFAALVPADCEAGVLTLVAPSRFVAHYIRQHFMPRLLTSVIAADPSIRDVSVIWTSD